MYMNILISKHSFKLCLLTRYSPDLNHNFSFSVFPDEIAGPDGPLRRRPVLVMALLQHATINDSYELFLGII